MQELDPHHRGLHCHDGARCVLIQRGVNGDVMPRSARVHGGGEHDLYAVHVDGLAHEEVPWAHQGSNERQHVLIAQPFSPRRAHEAMAYAIHVAVVVDDGVGVELGVSVDPGQDLVPSARHRKAASGPLVGGHPRNPE